MRIIKQDIVIDIFLQLVERFLNLFIHTVRICS